MIKNLFKKFLLIDIIQSLVLGINILFTRKIVTKNLEHITIDNELLSKNILFIDNSKCIGCKTCMRICPVKAITIIDRNTYEFKKEYCSHCKLCEKCCPKRAIKFIH
ncbi:MAG: 4Fe-4S binding protein [Alphaproteobacteria bacterium]|nr:4Fe-4S binding protein [Alphaproteobacteria bacterium]